MLDNIHQLPWGEVAAVEWLGDPFLYDLQLYNLGEGHDEFWALNPAFQDFSYHHWIQEIPDSRKCIVFMHRGEWVAKLFKDGWYPYHGYEAVEIPIPKLIWQRNPDIDISMAFDYYPPSEYKLDFWDRKYEMVWYLDSRFFPGEERIWVFKAVTSEKRSNRILKDMGTLTPEIEVDYNDSLPDLGVDVDQCCPPYWDLGCECAYELDPRFRNVLEDPIWVIKFRPKWAKPKYWKWYGTITPQYKITVNPDLPKLKFDFDFAIPWHDLAYEHVWFLDKKHAKDIDADIWAVKIKATENIKGSKVVGTVELDGKLELNPAVTTKFKLPSDFVVQYYDLGYQFVWISKENDEKVWVAKLSYVDKPIGIKEIEITNELNPDIIDVIFISYGEPNAEENWARVKEKAPWAQRVDGVKGILEAHKAAAKLSRTEMFYVVDGDALLFKKFDFSYKPSIFDRDCTYIWSAKNPLADLTYGHGGVKLFSKDKLLKLRKWRTLDMTTGVSEKIKVMSEISNWTAFNTDDFSTWKTAFRECVKLAFNVHRYPDNPEHGIRLEKWKLIDPTQKFGKTAVDAAGQAEEFVKDNEYDMEALININNRAWLESLYNKTVKKNNQ
jgi:hypothetical protein